MCSFLLHFIREEVVLSWLFSDGMSMSSVVQSGNDSICFTNASLSRFFFLSSFSFLLQCFLWNQTRRIYPVQRFPVLLNYRCYLFCFVFNIIVSLRNSSSNRMRVNEGWIKKLRYYPGEVFFFYPLYSLSYFSSFTFIISMFYWDTYAGQIVRSLAWFIVLRMYRPVPLAWIIMNLKYWNLVMIAHTVILSF